MSEPDDKANLVAVDWGTTSFRAYWVKAGAIAAEVREASGILTVGAGEHGAVLRGLIGRLPEPARDYPIMMSGMIGSRQGWIEAPYVGMPATLDDLAARVVSIDEPGLGPIRLIPGVMQEPEGGMPDVMRGEETQIFGALHLMGINGGVFIMPGTHSKRIEVTGDRLLSFNSYMTGEVFAALKGHTILGRLMAEGEASGEGFARGVAAGRDLPSGGALLNAVFGTRTLGLFGRIAAVELADYLSGLLIAAELSAALPTGGEGVVVGSGELVSRYVTAAELLGRSLVAAPDRCVVAGQIAVMRRLGDVA
jgi:2-dehydro-3-deoxygalactonokinase